MSQTGDVQFRGVSAAPDMHVVADNVTARARPADDEPVVATLGRGTVGKKLSESGQWTRIELADGRRVWVLSTELSLPARARP